MTAKVDSIIAGYVKIRDQLTALRTKHAESEDVLKIKMSKIEAWLMNKAIADGVDSFKTPGGTAYRTTKDSITVSDRIAFFDFAIANDQIDLISSAASKTNVKTYIDEFGELPPGLKRTVSYSINVKRPRAQKEK